MDDGIAPATKQCIKRFEDLQVTVPVEGTSGSATIAASFKESDGRFRVWCGNIGAHKTDRSSLDYRLRNSSRTKASVVQFLAELEALLLEGMLAIILRALHCAEYL